LPPERERDGRDVSPSPDVMIAKVFSVLLLSLDLSQYLEVLFRVSINGFNIYEGSSVSRSLSDRPMDEVNNFIFWRDFIFSHFSTYLIGTKALEAYLSNANASLGRDQFPGDPFLPTPSLSFNSFRYSAPSRNAPSLPSPRSLRFVIVPHSIQCTTEIWLLEALSSRHLVDHLFSLDSSAHVFLLMEQRFQSELVR
jgi:hypothetical protein